MGYPLEQFVEQDIKHQFKCQICKGVLQDPVVLDPCEHVLCKKCCDEWKKRSNICPVGRCQIKAIKKPQRLFLSLLNDLKMYCRFKAEEDGCTRILPLGDMPDHEERCDLNPENQKEKECDGGCGAILNRVKHRNHNCITYLKDKLQAKDEEVNALKHQRSSRHKEMKVLKDKLAKYRQRYGSHERRAGTGNNNAPTSSSSSSSRGPTYDLSAVQRKELEVIVNTTITENRINSNLTTVDRLALEEQVEATLNEQFTQEARYGPNTFWRVGLMDPKCKRKLLNGHEPPCPCHRGASEERRSKHYGGYCSGGGDFELLSTHNFIAERSITARIAHYVPI